MTDLRNFAYVLEPVRRRVQWRFDAALARLARLRKQVSDAERECQVLGQLCGAHSQDAMNAWRDRADPAAQARALHFIASLRANEEAARQRIAALQEQVDEARQHCVTQEMKLQALQEHRSGALDVFVREEGRRAIARSDDEWLAHRERTLGGQA